MAQRIAIVTGAAGGLGRAFVRNLSDQGLRVAGFDIDGAGLAEIAGDTVFTVTVDLTDADAVRAAVARVVDHWGGVDVLVNNAGTCLMDAFPDVAPDRLDRQMALNFSSAFHCCQAAVPVMLGRDGVKKIINISSNGAYNFDVFDPPAYRASKAALDTLTKDLARRYARDRIAVNSIAPAMTETPLFGVLDDATLQHAIAQMPHGHAMQPDQIAAWVGFLAGPGGDVCSGNVIVLNQGRDVR